jgi:hypothetical protein
MVEEWKFNSAENIYFHYYKLFALTVQFFTNVFVEASSSLYVKV